MGIDNFVRFRIQIHKHFKNEFSCWLCIFLRTYANNKTENKHYEWTGHKQLKCLNHRKGLNPRPLGSQSSLPPGNHYTKASPIKTKKGCSTLDWCSMHHDRDSREMQVKDKKAMEHYSPCFKLKSNILIQCKPVQQLHRIHNHNDYVWFATSMHNMWVSCKQIWI